MSEENVEIVRSIFEAFNRRDWDAAFRDARPDVELTTPPGPQSGPNAGIYRGREECQRFWEELLTAFDAASAEPEEFLEWGDQVAVVVKGRMRPKGSSAEIENRTGALWTIRDGMVVSTRVFAKPEEALEAAGLSE
jgi:ketosteroid isomerase-like protein